MNNHNSTSGISARVKALLLTGCLLAIASNLQAQTSSGTFTNGDGNGLWSDGGNWAGGTSPGSGFNTIPLYLTNTGSATVLNVDSVGASGGTLEVSAGASYTITGNEINFYAGNGNFDNGSTTYVDNTLNFMYGNANVPLSNTTLLGGTGSILLNSGNYLSLYTEDFNPSNNFGPTLSPGDPLINGGVGTLTIGGGLALGNGSGGVKFNFAFGPTGNSMVALSGNLLMPSFGGETFNITNSGSDGPGTYNLITYSGSAISPSTLAADTLNLPAGWVGSLESTDGVVALDLTSVPEPGTYVMILGGAGMLLGLRRYRRRGQA